MGLDNGFIVKSRSRTITREMLPKGIMYPFEHDYNVGPEIIYWRKCWGLRNHMVTTFGMTEDQYTLCIETVEDLAKVQDIIRYFSSPKIWEAEGRSIWDWDVMRQWLKTDLQNLKLMEQFMRENPDVYLEFYDSY